MKKLDQASLQSIMDEFTKPSIVHITKEDLDKFNEAAQSIYYSEYLADDKYRGVRIGERIRCDLAEFGSDNSAALYFVGDPDMEEVEEIINGLNTKTEDVIWGYCEGSSLEVNELKVMLLFFEF
jgi:hypothetical protein